MRESPENSTQAGHRARQILLIDDYPLGRKMVSIRLRQAGFEVTAASTAEDALRQARRMPPDAVVSDIRMTGMNGFELCEVIRKEPGLARIPVLLVSSNVEDADRQRARALGVKCLLRTSDMREVLQALADVFGASGRS